FLVALQATNTDGDVTYAIASNDLSDDTDQREGENSGIRLSERPPKGLGLATSLVGILTTAADADGIANDITIVDYNVDSRLSAGFKEISFGGVTADTIFNATLVGSDGASVSNRPLDTTILAFDTYRPSAGVELHDTTRVGYGVAWPVRGDRGSDYVTVSD